MYVIAFQNTRDKIATTARCALQPAQLEELSFLEKGLDLIAMFPVSYLRILGDVDLHTLVSNASLKHYDIRCMLVAGARSSNRMSFGCVLIAVHKTFAGFVSRARFEWQDQDATVSAEK